MTRRALLIEVHLLDQRWNGVGDWPPSPFRLFQALVAGAYGGRWQAEDANSRDVAFRWLEALPPPTIAAPPKAELRSTTYFVPNNDLDAVGGDPRRVAEIRTAKTVKPILLEADQPFLYVWRFEDGEQEAECVADLAERLHTLGRGVDAAFARGEVLDAVATEERLLAHGGALSVPCNGRGRSLVPCPAGGSLDSLKRRHTAATRRFTRHLSGRAVEVWFHQPPKSHFRPVGYDRAPARLLFDLVPTDGSRLFAPWAMELTSKLVTAVRDLAASRLV
jgi:CRISPR-associated protein Csb2